MKPVIIESPFAGCSPLNRAYLHACIRDCLSRGETPYASHKMLPGALDDTIPEERELGISAGLELREHLIKRCGAVVAFYVDLGWSSGMDRALPNSGPQTATGEVGPESVNRVSAEAGEVDPIFSGLVTQRKPETWRELRALGDEWREMTSPEHLRKSGRGW